MPWISHSTHIKEQNEGIGGDNIRKIKIFPFSSIDAIGDKIVGELHENGEVELFCHGEGSLSCVFSSVNAAKECMMGEYSVELVRAVVRGTEGAFLIKAVKT